MFGSKDKLQKSKHRDILIPGSKHLYIYFIIEMRHWDIEALRHWDIETLGHWNIKTNWDIETLRHWDIETWKKWPINER